MFTWSAVCAHDDLLFAVQAHERDVPVAAASEGLDVLICTGHNLVVVIAHPARGDGCCLALEARGFRVALGFG